MEESLKLKWYEDTEKILNERIVDFYTQFYNCEVKSIGSGYRLEPCPMCGHHDSCTLKGNSVHCFSGSCSWKGTHITAWYSYSAEKLGMPTSKAIEALDNFTGLRFPGDDGDFEKYEKEVTKQSILLIAEQFYYEQLINCSTSFLYKNISTTPLDYLTKIRKRKRETIDEYKIGFSQNYNELLSILLAEGYSKEAIAEAKVWIPEGLFVYWYRHPTTKSIVRLNTKNPFLQRYKKREGLQVITGDIIQGFSRGDKCLYFSKDFSFEKDTILCEGENDFGALVENKGDLDINIVATGGTIESEQLRYLSSKPSNMTIFLMYDNDEAGNRYQDFTNDYFADMPVKKIIYSQKDPDDYFCQDNYEPLDTLIKNAQSLTTDKFKIHNSGKVWTIATREKKLEFILKGEDSKGSFKGTASYYTNNVLVDRDEDILLVKCKKIVKPLNFYLYDHLISFFNDNIEKRNIDELIYIYQMSSRKEDIIKVIAQNLYNENMPEDKINDVKVKLKHNVTNYEDVMDEILKEVNNIANKRNGANLSSVPKIRIGQYFNVRNNDAYFYFTCVKNDGDTIRKLPFLLRNDGATIRLDILKRKDSQCLILIDNKYELQYEVPDAILELDQCSLTEEWVDKFKKGEIPDYELNPRTIVKNIEKYVRKFYYCDNDNIYKILSLYIYMTYFYELFAQVPYLFLNGSKGSGKSILDETIRLLAFNTKMAVHISEAAMFRMLSFEGGTLILDEQEGLTSKQRTMDSGMAAILKGGYSRSGRVYRTNTDKGPMGTNNKIDSFSIYGPKVISNIMGMDDVIEDRCIIINTYALKLTKETKMEDPKYYGEEKLDEIRELTSKCAISALRVFQKLSKIYNDCLFETGNARLSQILTPLMAVALLVDDCDESGEYMTALSDYWNFTLRPLKETVEKNTPEGIIKKSVEGVAKELLGITPRVDFEYTIANNHRYNEPIKFNLDEGWFEINVLHLKCFIEEAKPGETIFAKYIPKWLKTVFKIPDKDVKRRVVTIENEELIKEFRGNIKPKVYCYRFWFADFVDNSSTFFENKTVNDDEKNKLF